MKTYSAGKAPRGHGISPRQIKIIHTVKNALGMMDDEYRDFLWNGWKVHSSKELTWRLAEEVVEELQAKKGTPAPPKRPLPFADLDGRPGMATGAQCRLMAASWSKVSRAPDPEAKDKALDRFIKRIVGVESIRFVKGFQVSKIMKAINAMKDTKEVDDAETTDQADSAQG